MFAMQSKDLTLTTVLISTLIFLVSYLIVSIGQKLLKSYNRNKLQDAIAGTSRIRRHWLLGHLPEYSLATAEGRTNSIKRTEAYPKMFNFWYSPIFSVLHLYHPESAGPVLKSNYTYTSKNTMGYRFSHSWIGNGLITSSGEHWARHRKMLTPAFHFKLLKSYAKTFNTSANILVRKWKQNIDVSFDVQKPISLMAMQSLLKCAMSVDEDCQNLESVDNPTAKYVQAVCDIENVIITRLRNVLYHFDWIFYWSALAKRQRVLLKVLDDYANNVIHERMKERKEINADDLEAKDFLDALFNARDDNGKALRIDEIKDEVATFLFAGHDTTTSAISWCLYNLAMHPNLQKKCQEEVLNILRDNEYVEWDDINKFEYLTMFVKESMRLFSSVYGIARRVEKDIGVIPKDTTVAFAILTHHRNRSVWENPDIFDPERFSKENRKNIPPLAYIPFSAGPRNCIGQQFAMNEIKITLALVLKTFQIYRDSETPEPVFHPKLILQCDDGIFVKLRLNK